MFELIGSGNISTAEPVLMLVAPRQPGATDDGQVKPLPNTREPSRSSLLRLTSRFIAGVSDFQNETPSAVRLTFRSTSDPVPTPPGRATTWGVVVPKPSRPVLTLYGSTWTCSL